MNIAILRRSRNASISMDVYTDGLVSGLKTVRPHWNIAEFSPSIDSSEIDHDNAVNNPFLLTGISKYYERYWKYPRSFRSTNADIYHVIDHSEGHLNYWLRKYDKNSVVTCHDLINLVQPQTFQGRAQLPVVSMLAWKKAVESMKYANHIISVSQHTKNDIVNSLGIDENNISVIHNAVNAIFKVVPKAEVTSFRAKMQLSDEEFCLLNVGSNHSRKNVITILYALDVLKKQDVPIHFWKVGKNFTDEQWKFIRTHKLESNVTYLGQPVLPDLIKIYNSADVLVAPSLYEGFGLTILEAMACGLPVITSNVTSLPEVTGNAAILVEPVDVNQIVQEIKSLYYTPNSHQDFVRKGVERASQFTWEKTAEKVAILYEKLVN